MKSNRLLKKLKVKSEIIISWIYNVILRLLFHTPFRDISTGSRLIKKSLLKKINLISNSPFFKRITGNQIYQRESSKTY